MNTTGPSTGRRPPKIHRPIGKVFPPVSSRSDTGLLVGGSEPASPRQYQCIHPATRQLMAIVPTPEALALSADLARRHQLDATVFLAGGPAAEERLQQRLDQTKPVCYEEVFLVGAHLAAQGALATMVVLEQSPTAPRGKHVGAHVPVKAGRPAVRVEPLNPRGKAIKLMILFEGQQHLPAIKSILKDMGARVVRFFPAQALLNLHLNDFTICPFERMFYQDYRPIITSRNEHQMAQAHLVAMPLSGKGRQLVDWFCGGPGLYKPMKDAGCCMPFAGKPQSIVKGGMQNATGVSLVGSLHHNGCFVSCSSTAGSRLFRYSVPDGPGAPFPGGDLLIPSESVPQVAAQLLALLAGPEERLRGVLLEVLYQHKAHQPQQPHQQQQSVQLASGWADAAATLTPQRLQALLLLLGGASDTDGGLPGSSVQDGSHSLVAGRGDAAAPRPPGLVESLRGSGGEAAPRLPGPPGLPGFDSQDDPSWLMESLRGGASSGAPTAAVAGGRKWSGRGGVGGGRGGGRRGGGRRGGGRGGRLLCRRRRM